MKKTTTDDMRPARAHNQALRERDDGNPRAFRARRAAKTMTYRTRRAANRAGVEV